MNDNSSRPPMPSCPMCRPMWAVQCVDQMPGEFARQSGFLSATMESMELTCAPLCDHHWAEACRRRGILRLGGAA